MKVIKTSCIASSDDTLTFTMKTQSYTMPFQGCFVHHYYFINITKSSFTVLLKFNKQPKILISDDNNVCKVRKDKWDINSLARV